MSRPSPADELVAQGQALQREGNLLLAEVVFRQALQSQPRHARALALLGLLEARKGNGEAASGLLRQASEADPAAAGIHFNLGVLLHGMGRHEDALASFRRVTELQPDSADAHMNAGVALYELKRFEEAWEFQQRALALDPDSIDVHLNLGNALMELHRHDEALAAFQRVIDRRPRDAAALMNKANALRDLRRFSEALDFYDRALAADPSNADVHFNRSLCLLTLGDFERGWPEYEWRRKVPALHDTTRKFNAPLWLGEAPLQGKTILLHAEQGLGDTLHVCRYASLLGAAGANVVLEVQKPLVQLMQSLHGVARVVARGSDSGPYDYHCPLLSLPFACKTTLDNMPATVPYLFAEPERIDRWRPLIEARPGLKAGLAWSGNAAYRNDHHRSIALDTMLSAIPPGVECWSIQKDVREEDLELIRSTGRVQCFEDNDFVDTAAQIASLDLAICVETSIAQLAAALGKPTWVLLSFNSDWRWLWDRDDSPWYPNVRLFRQSRPGEWAPVLARLAAELAART